VFSFDITSNGHGMVTDSPTDYSIVKAPGGVLLHPRTDVRVKIHGGAKTGVP